MLLARKINITVSKIINYFWESRVKYYINIFNLLQVVDYLTLNEITAIFHSQFIKNNVCISCLYLLHNILDRILMISIGMGFQSHPINVNNHIVLFS